MNYYDYRSYFQQITGDLDSIQSKQDDLKTELRAEVDELKTELQTLTSTVNSEGLFIGAVVLISAFVRIFWK